MGLYAYSEEKGASAGYGFIVREKRDGFYYSIFNKTILPLKLGIEYEAKGDGCYPETHLNVLKKELAQKMDVIHKYPKGFHLFKDLETAKKFKYILSTENMVILLVFYSEAHTFGYQHFFSYSKSRVFDDYAIVANKIRHIEEVKI